ncbi:MAG: alpha-amylase family glycosyl hydrolase, partial [Oscillospiraceae bacterium]
MNCIPYDARNQLYKSIFGAITDSETLRLRILIHRDARLTCAFMVLQDDNKKTEQIEMLPAEQYDSSYRWYECNLQKPVGIYRYSFFYESPFGRMDITRFKYSQGIVSADGEQWQLTVYSSAEKAPQNYSGGIIYQIFPDRFKKSGEIIKGFSDRMINEHWGAQPLYENNVIGKDYFGGNLKGITESLDYIKSLGTTMIYLNPIFESHSNHRYNTADYLKIDPTLGTNEDFIALCQEAHSRDIKIILDGVFSHTGDDSLYFNKYGRYKGGAWNDPNSSYYNWYDFGNYPTGYKCWWGVPSLPEIREENEEYIEFITGNNGVLEH